MNADSSGLSEMSSHSAIGGRHCPARCLPFHRGVFPRGRGVNWITPLDLLRRRGTPQVASGEDDSVSRTKRWRFSLQLVRWEVERWGGGSAWCSRVIVCCFPGRSRTAEKAGAFLIHHQLPPP